MSIQYQKTYRCLCAKKRPMPNEGGVSVCGCGRKATVANGKVILQARQRNK